MARPSERYKDYIELCSWVDVESGKRVTCFVHPYLFHTSDLYELVLETIYEASNMGPISDILYPLQQYDPYITDDEKDEAREAFFEDERYRKEYVFDEVEAAAV